MFECYQPAKMAAGALGFGMKKSSKAKYKSSATSELENDRFRPVLMEIVDNLVARKLSSMPNFSVVKAGSDFDTALNPDADNAASAVSVRQARHVPTWQKNVNKAPGVSLDGVGVGERIVVCFPHFPGLCRLTKQATMCFMHPSLQIIRAVAASTRFPDR